MLEGDGLKGVRNFVGKMSFVKLKNKISPPPEFQKNDNSE